METGKYEAIDVARYVVNRSIEIGYPCSNLKLQKLLYFIQRAYLYIYERPCFKDDIEAWKYGPVVPEVYRNFRMFGSTGIPKIEKYLKYSRETMKFDTVLFENDLFEGADIELFDYIVDVYKEVSPLKMVELTHRQYAWIDTFKRGESSIISNDLILSSMGKKRE